MYGARGAEDYTPAGAGAGWSGTLLWMAAKEKAKASAQRRYQETAPTEWQWVEMQPDRWKMICSVFAVNAVAQDGHGTRGGIVNKTLADIVKYANSQGFRMALRSVERYLPELRRHQLIRRESHWHPDSTEANPMSAPSTWFIRLRNAMPEEIIPPEPDEDDPLYNAKVEYRNDVWLRRNGLMPTVNRARMRLVAQRPTPPWGIGDGSPRMDEATRQEIGNAGRKFLQNNPL